MAATNCFIWPIIRSKCACASACGSISKASKLSFIRLAFEPTLQSKTHQLSCARGPVEISKTFLPCAAACNASAEDIVVLPTPPLPPTNNSRFIEQLLLLSGFGQTPPKSTSPPLLFDRLKKNKKYILDKVVPFLPHNKKKSQGCTPTPKKRV